MCDSFEANIKKITIFFLAKPNYNLKILKTIYCEMIQVKTITNCTLSQLFAFNPSNFRHGLHL